MGLFDLSVISVLFSLGYKLFCFARCLTHVMIIMLATPFCLMMTHGDGSCVVVVLVVVVVVEHKFSESGTP
jgi:hypothetical protein